MIYVIDLKMLMRFIVFVLLLNLCALTSYAQDAATSGVSSGIQVDQLTLEEIDYIVSTFSSCWIAPAGAIIEKGMMVKIAANYDEQGRVDEESVRFLDTNIDWEAYAESVFRPNWDKLSHAQKRQFKRLLQRDAIERYGHLFSVLLVVLLK